MPSITQGQPGQAIPTGTKAQRKLATQLGSLLQSGLAKGAAPLEGPLFSSEEDQIFQELFRSVTNQDIGTTRSKDFFLRLLSGSEDIPQITEEASTDFFTKGIANPLIKLVSERIVPEINRSIGGFTTRRVRAITLAFENVTAQLAGEAARLELARQQTNLQIQQFNLASKTGAAGALPQLETNRLTQLAGVGGVSESRQGRKLAEQSRTRPEANPFISPSLGFLGIGQTQITDTTRSSGFGKFIDSTNALFGTGGNIGTASALT